MTRSFHLALWRETRSAQPRPNVWCGSRAAARSAFWSLLLTLLVLPQAMAAAGYAALDRSMAQAIAMPQRDASSLSDLVKRASSAAVPDEAARNALAQREALAAALDRIAQSDPDDGALDLRQAGLLVDVMLSLDGVTQYERQRGTENALSAVAAAVWRRYVAPAIAATAAARREPLAPPAAGNLAGQWLDGGRTVRVFDLWADERNRTLAWSRADIATALPETQALLDRSASPIPQRARLALYVDLGALSDADRTSVLRAAETGAAKGFAVIADDVPKRMTACLGAKEAGPPHRGFEEIGKDVGRKAGPDREDGETTAAVRCRARTAPPAGKGQALLFDPVRKLRVRSFDLAAVSMKRVLAQAAAIAEVWP